MRLQLSAALALLPFILATPVPQLPVTAASCTALIGSTPLAPLTAACQALGFVIGAGGILGGIGGGGTGVTIPGTGGGSGLEGRILA